MDEKTELLICLGAAAATNCVPCFDYYFKKASTAGIPLEDVNVSIELAYKVKTGAGIVMRNSIREITDRECESGKAESGDHPCCK